MAAELPDEIDCRRLADEGGTLTGTVASARLHRIVEPLRLTEPASVQLHFRRNDDGEVEMLGSVAAALEGRCQRCLDWMPLPVNAALDLRIALTAGEDDEERVHAPDGRIDLVAMLEDEILLNCPMVPRHDDPRCHAAAPGGSDDAGERHKPFAALAELMKQPR